MDGGKCILQFRGVRPFFSDKYDITQHPNYKYLSDFDKTLHVSHWVAYPLHYVYRGSVNRQDDFGYDPKVNSSYQANLGRGSYNLSLIHI